MASYSQGYSDFFRDPLVVVGRVAELASRDRSDALSLIIGQYIQSRRKPENTSQVADLAGEVKKKVQSGDFDASVERVLAMVRQRRAEYYKDHKREFAPATKTTKDDYIYGKTLDAQDMSYLLCSSITDIPYLRRTLPHVDERKMKEVVLREETRRTYIQQRPYFGHSVYVQKSLPSSDGFGVEPVFFSLLNECFNQSWKSSVNCSPWILDNSEDGDCRHVCAIPYTGTDCLTYLLVFETGVRDISKTGVVAVPENEKILVSGLGHNLPTSPSKNAQKGIQCNLCQTIHNGDMHTAYNQQ